MGRPRKVPEDRRDARIEVRFTFAERTEIVSRAGAFGLSASELVRHRVLGWRLPARVAEARVRSAIVVALMRLDVNLNQVARHLNAGRPAYNELHRLLREVRAEMDRLLDEDERHQAEALDP